MPVHSPRTIFGRKSFFCAGFAEGVQRLLAPSASSTSGVTLEGEQLNHQAEWQGKLKLQTLKPTGNGSYVLRVGGESAALLAVPVAASTLNAKPQQAAGPSPLFGS